jgi:hypothetical protein
MKRTIIILGLVATVVLTGCYNFGPCLDGIGPVVTETREITNFSAVTNEGSFEVRITEADEFSVVVEAQENLFPIIQTFVSGHSLVVQKQFATCFRSGSPVIVHVTMPELEAIRNTGSGQVIADVADTPVFNCANSGSGRIIIDSIYTGILTMKNSASGRIYATGSYADDLKITLSGSGTIDAGTIYNTTDVNIRHSASGRVDGNLINGDRVEVSLSGSGKMNLAGDALFADYSLGASGTIDALDLMVEDAESSITGSGKIFVYATETLDVIITGSGDVIYLGNPVITSHITGSGEVRPY